MDRINRPSFKQAHKSQENKSELNGTDKKTQKKVKEFQNSVKRSKAASKGKIKKRKFKKLKGGKFFSRIKNMFKGIGNIKNAFSSRSTGGIEDMLSSVLEKESAEANEKINNLFMIYEDSDKGIMDKMYLNDKALKEICNLSDIGKTVFAQNESLNKLYNGALESYAGSNQAKNQARFFGNYLNDCLKDSSKLKEFKGIIKKSEEPFKEGLIKLIDIVEKPKQEIKELINNYLDIPQNQRGVPINELLNSVLGIIYNEEQAEIIEFLKNDKNEYFKKALDDDYYEIQYQGESPSSADYLNIFKKILFKLIIEKPDRPDKSDKSEKSADSYRAEINETLGKLSVMLDKVAGSDLIYKEDLRHLMSEISAYITS